LEQLLKVSFIQTRIKLRTNLRTLFIKLRTNLRTLFIFCTSRLMSNLGLRFGTKNSLRMRKVDQS